MGRLTKTKQPIRQNTKSKTINKNIVSRPKRINKNIKVNREKVNNNVNKNTSQVIPIKFIKQENEEIIENKSKKTTKETNKAKKNLNKESKVIVAKHKVENKKKKLPAKSGWWNKEVQNN